MFTFTSMKDCDGDHMDRGTPGTTWRSSIGESPAALGTNEGAISMGAWGNQTGSDTGQMEVMHGEESISKERGSCFKHQPKR